MEGKHETFDRGPRDCFTLAARHGSAWRGVRRRRNVRQGRIRPLGRRRLWRAVRPREHHDHRARCLQRRPSAGILAVGYGGVGPTEGRARDRRGAVLPALRGPRGRLLRRPRGCCPLPSPFAGPLRAVRRARCGAGVHGPTGAGTAYRCRLLALRRRWGLVLHHRAHCALCGIPPSAHLERRNGQPEPGDQLPHRRHRLLGLFSMSEHVPGGGPGLSRGPRPVI